MGETKFQLREFPRSGSKAEDVKERAKINDYNGQQQVFYKNRKTNPLQPYFTSV